jgi:ubiquinone/menaquinone biosynthesis C-methylase UbiE
MTLNSTKVASYFQRRADKFDALYERERTLYYFTNRMFRRGLYQRVELTLAALDGLENFTVLDVGSGSGRNSALFIEAGARRVLGIDVSPRMVELANQYVQSKDVKSCEFMVADFLQLDLGEKFDVAIALGVFDYTAEPEVWLRRMMSFSKNRVIVSFPGTSLLRSPFRKFRYALRNCPVYFYTRQQLEELARTCGLRTFEIADYASSGMLLVGEV